MWKIVIVESLLVMLESVNSGRPLPQTPARRVLSADENDYDVILQDNDSSNLQAIHEGLLLWFQLSIFFVNNYVRYSARCYR